MAESAQPPSSDRRTQPTTSPRMLQTKFSFPQDFIPDSKGLRVAKLNSKLLDIYGGIGVTFNKISRAKEELKRSGLDHYTKTELMDGSTMDKKILDGFIGKARNYLGEIDAIGGQKAFYFPDEPMMKKLIGDPKTWRRTDSGSLAYLANDTDYIPEENFVKPAFEAIAFSLNRIQYLQKCNCNDKTRNETIEELLKKVEEVIENAGTGPKIVYMPDRLREAAGVILSDYLNEPDSEAETDSDEDILPPYVETPADARRRRAKFVKELQTMEQDSVARMEKMEERLIELQKEEAEEKRAKRRKQR